MIMKLMKLILIKIKHKCEKCGNVHLMWEEYNEKTNITTWHVKNITERYNKC